MTRRELVAAFAGLALRGETGLTVPVRLIFDRRAKGDFGAFREGVWAEAVGSFARCGIRLEWVEAREEMGLLPSGRPRIQGLEHGRVNVVVTDLIPMQWDKAQGLAGVTTQYDGYHLCLVAMRHAHGHQIPFVSTNTCVHELLHVLMGDVFELRPKGWAGAQREWRIDSLATRMWLFGEGEEVRAAVRGYLGRMGR